MTFCDGNGHYLHMPPIRDFKRAFNELKSFIDNFTLEEIVTSKIGPETAAGKLLTKN